MRRVVAGVVLVVGGAAASERHSAEDVTAAMQESLDFLDGQMASHPTVTGEGTYSPRKHMGLDLLGVIRDGINWGLQGWKVQAELNASPSPSYWEASAPASFCAADAKPTRKEIRDLSQDERTRLFAAMRVLSTVPGPQGRATYGDRFVSLQEIAAHHASGANHFPCDAIHVFGSFLPYHRSIVARVEQAVWAVDAGAPAMPYYDANADIVEYGLEHLDESPVWADDMFGPMVGDRDNGYVVPTVFGGGPWPVANAESTPTAETLNDVPINVAGVARLAYNPNSSPYVTRFRNFMNGVDLKDSRLTSASKGLERILMNATETTVAATILDNGVMSLHTVLHVLLGAQVIPDSEGRLPGDQGFDYDAVFGALDGDVVPDECAETCAALEDDCEAYSSSVCEIITQTTNCTCPACVHCGGSISGANATTPEFGPTWWAAAPNPVKAAANVIWGGSRQTTTYTGCLSAATCPMPSADGVWDPDCLATVTPEKCVVPPIVTSIAAVGFSGDVAGDWQDMSGPNDPVFVFFHANLDRLFYEWQAKQVHQGTYPANSTTGWEAVLAMAPPPCAQHHGVDGDIYFREDDDYFAWSTMFEGVYPVQGHPSNIDTMTFSNLPYTYDTVCPDAAEPDTEDDMAAVQEDDDDDAAAQGSSSKKSSKNNVGLVVGIAVAGVVLILLMLFLIFCCFGSDQEPTKKSPAADDDEAGVKLAG